MKIVVDVNELLSLLIKGSWRSRSIFFSKEIELIAPELLLKELEEHKQEILDKSQISPEEFFRLLNLFESRISVVRKETFEEHIPKAVELLHGHDKDRQYFALALKFNCPFWSEEKFKDSASIEVLNSYELFKLLSKE